MEAQRESGERLGTVGGRIVAEVLIGLVTRDPSSYLAGDGWRPELPWHRTGDFGIADLVRFAEGTD